MKKRMMNRSTGRKTMTKGERRREEEDKDEE